MPRLEQLLVFLFFVLLPSQLGYHFWPEWSLVNGVRVDYLSPTLYLTDLVLLALFIVHRKIYFKPKLISVFVILAGINIAIALSPQIAIYKWIRVVELLWLGLFIFHNWVKVMAQIKSGLAIAVTWTSMLACMQIVSQRSLGGLWYWLGERAFDISTPGIARAEFFGELVLRPYATLPHPNALAAFLFVSLILLFAQKWHNPKLFSLWMLLPVATIAGSMSRSVLVGLGVVLLGLLINKVQGARRVIVITICTLVLGTGVALLPGNPDSVNDRADLFRAVVDQLRGHVVFGVGLGNSIRGNLETSLSSNNFKLALQPVHNIYLLGVVELGIVLVMALIWLLSRSAVRLWKRTPGYWKVAGIVVLGLGLVDHYWVTLHQTSLLASIFFAVVALQSDKRNSKN